MVRFTGYVKKEDPKWLSILFYAIVILLAIAIIFGITYLAQWFGTVSERKAELAETSTTTSTTIMTTTISIPTTTVTVSILKGAGTLEELAAKADVSVEKIVLTSKIESNLPTDNLENISTTEHGTVYCYTRINCSVIPQAIKHVWVDPSGSTFAEIKLNITRNTVDTWSYVSLYGSETGNWQVQVRKINDELITKRDFTVVP